MSGTDPSSLKGATPKTLDNLDIAARADEIKRSNIPVVGSSIVIEGQKVYDGWFLKADKIEFKPGAALHFSKQAQDTRRNFFIICKELVCDDASPAAVTFEYTEPGGTLGSTGQAATGQHAVVDDHSGSNGASGDRGPEGQSGYNAPNITFVTLQVSSSGPIVDFRGRKGGQGGQGQTGGDGGNGAKGHPASSGGFDCKNGAGDGGNGGIGGNGGQGGPGGHGGVGGNVTIIAPSDLLPSLSQKFRILVSGGPSGDPGINGHGGQGGLGGPNGAKALPWCKDDGRNGNRGNVGGDGPTGPQGVPGVDGDFFVGSISKEQFDAIYS